MANNQVSAQARGIVVILQGKAWVVNAEGVRKALQVGDEVQEGQTVITEDGARLELALPNGQPLVVASGRELLIEGNLLGTDPTDNTDAAIADLNSGAAQIARTLAGTGDLSLELDPTAAGLAGGQTSEAHSFVRILRIEENLSPLSLDRAGEQGDNNQIFLNGSEQAALLPTPTITHVGSTDPAVNNVTVDEGTAAVFTVNLSNAASTPTTFALALGDGSAVLTQDYTNALVFSNGVTFSGGSVTVPAGVTSFTVSVPTVNDSVSEPSEAFTLSVGGVTGTGNITDTTPSISITDMNGAAAGLVTVNESALPTGTNPTNTAESVDGTIVISAAKGLDSIDFGATTVTLAQLNGLGAAPVTIASPDGAITLTDYNPVTGTISYTYTIAAAQTGPNAASTSVADTLTVTVRDAGGFTAAAIFTATILDDAPIARDDTNSITEDALPDTISGNVFTNDSIGADTLSNPIAATAGTINLLYGTLNLTSAGNYVYTLNNANATVNALTPGMSLVDTYTYTLTDKDGDSTTATLRISINGTNDAPVITNAAAALLGTVVEAGNLDDGTAVTGTTSATGTLSASDVDSGATQTWTLQGTPSTTYGSMALVGSKWTYTIDNSLATTQALKEGQSVTQTYTVRVTDDFGAYKDQTVTITINGTNDKPVAIGSNATGLEDAASIPVILQGTDVDGTVASFNLSSLPTNGALYLDAALTILVTTGTDIAATGNSLTLYFKPAADFNSGSLSGSITPSFNFTATDNNGAVSNVATDTITVTAVSDGAPTAVNDGFKTLAGTPITFTRAQLLANDSLLDHATISSTGALPTGLTYNSATQTYTYAPLTAGSGSFTYTITDDDGQTSTATVSLNAYSSTTDLATVYESALSTGSGTGVSTVTGNLFTNDAGLTGNITSISGGTSTLSGNTYTVTTSYGTLVVDRTTGAYTYTLSAAVDNDSATGATTTELLQSFTYARTGGSANLLVTIIDDVPSAQNHIIEVPQASALTNYNLVLMLDVSGSMIATNSGGAVRLVDANGNVTISTRLEAAKQAMIDMVTKYFNESASVSVKVGYFSASATAGTTSLTTLSSVIAAINAIPASGGNTNYEDALYKIQDMFGVVDTSKTNVTYFISDGVPTVQVGSGSGTTSPATETNGTSNPISYAQFLANNPSVLSYSIGIGGGISNTAPLDSIHNVDADASNVKDSAILVNDLNQLSTALTSTIPSTFGGNIGTNGRNPFVNIGADGGFVQHIDLLLDSNDADTAPDSIVRFTFNGSDQITYDNFFLTGTHTTVTVTGTMLTLNSALGFTKGLLVFNFATGDYSYYSQGAATNGDQFDIAFTVQDNDGDTANAIETIKIINGKPVAYEDRDTLLPKNTFFDGNVITGTSTDGANQAVTVFGAGAGADNIVDNAKITSIVFNGATFNLSAVSSGTLGGGTYTVNAAKELTWTSSTDSTNTLVFHSDGYYKYTPPSSQTTEPTQGSSKTVSFDTAALVSAGGLTLQGVTRTGNVNAPDGTVDYSSSGVGVTGGSSNTRVDNLETLIIKFNAATYAYGVQNVSLNINTSSNLGSGTAIAVSVYDILGNLLGQVAITSEGIVALPSNWSNIGSILIEPNSNAQVLIDDVRFNAVNLNTSAALIPDTIISYTLTDDQGDTSSANLTLHIVTNEIQGSTGNDTITGTAANDAIEGFAGNDTIYGGAGNDIIKGGAGDDKLYGDAGDDQIYGGDGNDTIYGGTGNDLISGDAGNDILYGEAGNDTLRGGAGNDVLDGGAGNDVLYGGAGNDTLTGGLGSDTFKWELADIGSKGSPASDTITDFDVASVASGGDALDLRDLLTGENHIVGTGNLASYLHFEKSGANTVIHVSSTGDFAAGFDATKEVQTITLNGVDLVGSLSNDQQVIQSLLNNNKLIVD